MVVKNQVALLQPTGEVYCQPTADEISEPSNIFVNGVLLKAKSVSWSTTSTVSQPPVRLKMEDTGEAHLHALREQFEPASQACQKRIDIGKEKPQRLSEDDFPRLCQAWQQEFVDIVNGMKEELPSWRERNDNTIKDVTPLPDQEVIREDVAKARYRSKIDLTDAYEQVCIHVEDIPKTVFASLMGTFEHEQHLRVISARLPDELLAKIFICNLSPSEYDQVRWMRVAGVCTMWRRIVLACPYLWNRAWNNNIDWLNRVILPRSGQLPLHIRLTRQPSPEGLDIILGEIHRIQKLKFFVKDDLHEELKESLLTVLAKPAPMLESFGIKTHSAFVLPDSLFHNRLPELRRLHLSRVTMPAGSPLTSGLTKFTLSDASGPLSQLISLLATAPHLVDLHLTYACSKVDTTTIIPVHLPRLQYLKIFDDTPTCAAILSGIDHPPTTHFKIHTFQTENIMAGHALARELAAHISIVGLSHDHWATKIYDKVDFQIDDPQAKIILRDNDLKAFIEGLSLHHLQVLKLHEINSDFIVDIVRNSPCLNTIHVRHFTYRYRDALLDGISKDELTNVMRLHEDILDSRLGIQRLDDPLARKMKENPLSLPAGHELPKTSGPLSFPSLTCLYITGSGWVIDIPLLAAVLRVRANRGLPLQKLNVLHALTTHDSADEYVALIREVVKSVYWHGKNGVVMDTTEGDGGD
ncbi:hypothetical protein C0995_007389 [Termitomyces sp. Mi166|nr:hypothetical protein C0995_007389 [Termitomyces sp. Mi166\